MAEEQTNIITAKARKSQKTSPIAVANDTTDEEFIRYYLKPRYIDLDPMPNASIYSPAFQRNILIR